MQTIDDTVEGGSPGIFRFTRTGDASQSLTAAYSIDGAATPGSDYVALSGTVTFGANESTVDVSVDPIDDLISEFDESVNVTILALGLRHRHARLGHSDHPRQR